MTSPLFNRTEINPRPLRPYQDLCIEELRAGLKAGHRRQVLKLPTGAGKTRVAAELINRALIRGERSIFVVPRLSLIEQTVAAFEREGIGHIGVIQGQNFRTDSTAPVQVASAQTLVRREIPEAGLVIVDECHLRFQAINDWLIDPDWQKQSSLACRRRRGRAAWGWYGNRLSRPSRSRISFKMNFYASSGPRAAGSGLDRRADNGGRL